MRIEPTFLSLSINEWQDNASYLELSKIVSSIPAVNDAAERTVKLGSDFTGVITKNETRKQAILQKVELSRKIRSKPTNQYSFNNLVKIKNKIAIENCQNDKTTVKNPKWKSSNAYKLCIAFLSVIFHAKS